MIRSVKDIRTHFGSPDQTTVPYKAYMVITALEMEQFRREKERDNIRLRLANIESRLEAIKVEKTNILERINRTTEIAGRKTPGRIPDAPISTRSAGTGGFKFQY